MDLTDVDPIEMPAIPLELEIVEETAPTWRYGFWENISADEYASRQGVRRYRRGDVHREPILSEVSACKDIVVKAPR